MPTTRKPKAHAIVSFVRERTTKNKVVFSEITEAETPVIGSLYLTKDFLAGMGAEEAGAVSIALTVEMNAPAAAEA